jgi:hypothetical protein
VVTPSLLVDCSRVHSEGWVLEEGDELRAEQVRRARQTDTHKHYQSRRLGEVLAEAHGGQDADAP